MIRWVQKTFDWEYLIRFLAVATVLYVLGTAVVHVRLAVGAPEAKAVARAGI
jgi:uncharacterized membrane protein